MIKILSFESEVDSPGLLECAGMIYEYPKL
jgi:hypothetical protein